MSNKLAFRPRFRFLTPLSMEQIVDRINARADNDNPEGIIVKYVHNHLILDFPTYSKKFWSPQMDVNLEIDEETQQVRVRCMIGPSSTVWTMFMFLYGLIGFAALIGIVMGTSQWSMDNTPWGLWIFGVAAILGGILHLASLEGQRLSRDEMRLMKQFLDQALGCDCFQLSEQQREAEEQLNV